ncbi:MAG: PQQ-binding-like beta-propeller repeat protein [Planctomycetota bacterium]
MPVKQAWVAIVCGLMACAVAVGDDWPQFRGPKRDNISSETGLPRTWPEGGPKVLWSTGVCQGYAAAAIHGGRVYINDYSEEATEWYVRCLRLADGEEIWRFKESKRIRPNHAITRTVPAVDGKYVFSLDPKCIFHCLDAETGRELWRKSLVKDYQAKIPPWYNGQCPLIESDRVIIAPGGTEALMVALKKDTGEELWRTPNPGKWPLAHSSVMPAEIGGVKQYLWCTLFGPLGVSAETGELLWFYPRKFNIAVAPSPLAVGKDRVLMTAGYDAGSVMLQLRNEAGRFAVEPIFDRTSAEWSSDVHTPIVFEDHIIGVSRKKRGLLTCLDLDGNTIWDSQEKASFELGSYLMADGLIYILEGKTGMLRLVEANTTEYRELASAQVLDGHDVWGPLALSNGKLVVRDMTKMVCLDVGPPASASRVERLGIEGCESPEANGEEPIKANYRQVAVIAGADAKRGRFNETLNGLALDSQDRLYAVGDSVVRVFSPAGELLREWTTERPGYAVAVAEDGTVYVGQAGQVQVFDKEGKLRATWRDAERLGVVTAIGVVGDEVVLADAKDRCLRRYDRQGQFINNIGKDNRMHGFLIPNGAVDFTVDAQGVIHAANPGRHRVEKYTLEGKQVGRYGRFGGSDLAGFTGCCNPTNIALAKNGRVVVTVKADPHVKVFDAGGEKLLAIVGREAFDPNCKNMDVVVDSRGRIYVADTVRLQICVFAPEEAATQPAGEKTVKP